MPGGYFTITINQIPVFQMEPEYAEALRHFGYDPDEFDRMHWPTGASRYAHGRFLMHSADFDALVDNPNTPVSLVFGDDLRFDRMFIRNPIPILISEGQSVIAFELVDERYFWQDASFDETAIWNLLADDKQTYYPASLNEDDPWRPDQVVEAVVEQLPEQFARLPDFQLSPVAASRWVRDMVSHADCAGMVIDRVMVAAGFVMIAHPLPITVTAPGVPPSVVRYTFHRIDSGEQKALSWLEAFQGEIIAGGMFAPSQAVVPPADGILRQVVLDPRFSGVKVPEKADVLFPIFDPAAGFDPGDSPQYPVDRFHRVSIENEAPVMTPNADSITLFDHAWARFEGGVLQNETEIAQRALDVVLRYYWRFRSGACDLLLRGAWPVDQWVGGESITWIHSCEAGPRTRIRGEINSQLLGYTTKSTLTSADIFTTGRVRAVPRMDGGLLLDVLADSGANNLRLGIITEVFGTVNATYSAHAFNDPSFAVENHVPRRRDDISAVDMQPVFVGDVCIIGRDEDNGYHLWVDELRPTVPCVGLRGVREGQTARTWSVHGL